MFFPKVSIVITTYLPESKMYLDACMDSVANLNYPKDKLDVVLVGRPGYMPEYESVKTVSPNKEKFYNGEGANFGILSTDPESKYVLYLNDDVVLTADCLIAMVSAVGDNQIIAGPISNCDNYWKYIFQFPIQHEGNTHFINDRFYRFDDWKPYLKSMMNTKSVYPPGIIVTDFLCFYAVLLPRTVINKIGLLDEKFRTGPDDLDYSKRCRASGINVGIVTSALIWHFGGVSSEKTVSPQLREENAAYFKEKWGEEQIR